MKYHADPPAHIEARLGGNALSTLRLTRPEFLIPKKAKKQSEIDKIFAWDAFAETLAMAEGSAGLLLGKARPRSRETQVEDRDVRQEKR